MKLKLTILVVTMVAAGSLALAWPSSAVTGCPSSKPTWLGGTFRGSDGRSINAAIGFDLKDRYGRDVLVDGARTTDPPDGAYSFVQWLNRSVPGTGTTATTAPDGTPVVRNWGTCVAANITLAYIEIYPKEPMLAASAAGMRDRDRAILATNYDRYGLGAYYFLAVNPGTRMDVLLRTPLIYEKGGNTGGTQGYITKGGRPLPKESVKRVRAFTRQRGSACGIEGMAVIANTLLTGTTGRTYYKVNYLAAGQCGNAYQEYVLRVTCGAPACGPNDVLFLRTIRVVRGRWPRVDVVF